MNIPKCAFIGCHNVSIGSTLKQISKRKYADIPTCAYGNHWLVLRKIWDIEVLEMLFDFKTKRIKK